MALTGPITMENKNMSSFEMGKYAAFEDLYELADAGYSFTDALAVIDETLNAPLDKHASYEDDEYRLGVDALCYDFLKQAHNMFGRFDTSDSYDEDMFLYVFDKIAALDEQRMLELARRKKGDAFTKRDENRILKKVRAANERISANAPVAPGAAANSGGVGALTRRQLAIGAAGVAGLGGLGYGAKKLYDRRKQRLEEAVGE